MSVSWDISKCNADAYWELAKYNDPHQGIKQGDRIVTAECRAAIENCLLIDIGALTRANIADAMVRTRLFEAIDGARMHRFTENNELVDVFLWELLPQFIGLRTNVSDKSPTTWLKNFYRNMRARQERALARPNISGPEQAPVG